MCSSAGESFIKSVAAFLNVASLISETAVNFAIASESFYAQPLAEKGEIRKESYILNAL